MSEDNKQLGGVGYYLGHINLIALNTITHLLAHASLALAWLGGLVNPRCWVAFAQRLAFPLLQSAARCRDLGQRAGHLIHSRKSTPAVSAMAASVQASQRKPLPKTLPRHIKLPTATRLHTVLGVQRA